jgi:hypothetical protein
MRVFKLLFLLSLSFTSFVNGQNEGVSGDRETDNREKLRFGAKVGVNGSNIYDNSGDPFTADTKYSGLLGIFTAMPIGKYLGLQPEVLISQKGFKGAGRLLGNAYDFTRTTTFLDIPIQIALKPSEFITILGGPQYSYLIKQVDKFGSSLYSYEQEQVFRQDNIRKNIFGAVIGLDINIRHVTLSGRLAWDIIKNNRNGSQSTPRYKNKLYQVSIGFNF